jgi:hypothetical protein
MRWIGESVSTLVPSAAVGGDIVRARLAAISGGSVATAAGTVLVDLTLGVFTQAAFTLLGVVLLVNATGQKNFVGPTVIGTIVGVADRERYRSNCQRFNQRIAVSQNTHFHFLLRRL